MHCTIIGWCVCHGSLDGWRNIAFSIEMWSELMIEFRRSYSEGSKKNKQVFEKIVDKLLESAGFERMVEHEVSRMQRRLKKEGISSERF